MKTILTKYYTEEVYPTQREIWSDPLYNQNVRRAEECYAALLAMLPEQGQALLRDYSDSTAVILETVAERNFFLGARAGLTLLQPGNLELAPLDL